MLKMLNYLPSLKASLRSIYVKLIMFEVCEVDGFWPLEPFSAVSQLEVLSPLKVLVKRELRGTDKQFRVSASHYSAMIEMNGGKK